MKNVQTLILRPIWLSGKKVNLRELRSEDVTEDYVNWMNDFEVVRFTESRFIRHDLECIKKYVRTFEENQNSVLLGIFSKQENLHLGNIKLGPINWRHKIADIGLILGRKTFWRQGLATEAIILLCQYAFAGLRLHKLTSACYFSNKGSVCSFQKAGFTQEGLRKKHVASESGWEDVIEFGKINPLGE